MDGNFKAEHMKPKYAENELSLMDGLGYMVGSQGYKEYLVGTSNSILVSEGTYSRRNDTKIAASDPIATIIVRSARLMQTEVIWPQPGLVDLPVLDMDASYLIPWLTFKRENSECLFYGGKCINPHEDKLTWTTPWSMQ